MHRAWWIGLWWAVGCSFDAAELPGGGNPDAPMTIDAPGSPVDAPMSSIDAPPVDAGPPDARFCVVECVDERSLRQCPSGTVTDCPFDCLSTPTPHCGQHVPSNGVNNDLVNGTSAFVVPASTVYLVNTDTGAIITNAQVVIRGAGTGVIAGIGYYQMGNLAVFAAQSITVSAGATVQAYGTRSLVLLSAADVQVNGTINVSAGSCPGTFAQLHTCAGPGGGNGATVDVPGASGCGPGGNGQGIAGDEPETGGGGGGFGTAGGVGGPATDNSLGGTAGPSCGSQTLVPLLGGSGGGRGGFGGEGGGGGGALQITSHTRISLGAGGVVQAVGSGGGAGGGSGDGGGGGGAGGGVLLEAPLVQLPNGSVVSANGGGGGAGNGGTAGQRGTLTTDGALGGTGGNPGGRGGAVNPSLPGPGSVGVDGTGGGGGAAGRIRLDVLDPLEGGGIISPTATVGRILTI